MHIVRDLKISNSDFELLKAIGGECAGAFSILPVELVPEDVGQYKKLSDEELNKIILRKGQVFNLTSNEERPRLSLAGAQEKCPIFYDGENYYLPKDSAPSTHILKFEIAGYRNIPVYEYFMTKLAEAVGLPVTDLQLRKSANDYFLLIKRYDRIVSTENNVKRLHQEDFCQALGVGYDKKYQQEGGPSFQDCYNLAGQITVKPLKDAENLLKWQIFNVLAGNSDGHAKNIAIIYNDNYEAELAPFYDLVCTRAIERINSKLAMSVGGEYNPDNVQLRHWEILAGECNINVHYLREMVLTMAETLLDKLAMTLEEFEIAFGPYPALQRVQKIVLRLCKKTLRER
jgi:serine/threonine-protein kinase HipA